MLRNLIENKNNVSQRGFTIVELLIVIVVIAILAAITIVSYAGISNRAKVAAVQADLSQSQKQLELFKTGTSTTDTYPILLDCNASPAANTICLRSTSGSSYQYTYTSANNNFCLSVTNGTIAFNVSSINRTVNSGVCSGHTAATATPPNTSTATLLAGSGTSGATNSTGAAASFNSPNDIAIDASGNVYVADLYNHVIRKITSAGVVTTLAGSGSATFADGTGTSASFNYPQSVDVDAAGNVYVADSYNNRIRKITSAGVVTTLAGSGSGAYADGTGAAASFSGPRGIALDTSGNVYVADTNNARLRKITPAGVVTTLAGSGGGTTVNGTGTGASFNMLYSVAVDTAGTIYGAEYSGHTIRKITAAGVVTTLAGSGVAGSTNGTGTAAQFNEPNGVAVTSEGNVYVAEYSGQRIRMITSAGVVTTFAGSGTSGYADGVGTAIQFANPRGVEVSSGGIVYVADSSNHRIRVIK
jgi:prepilin-type N-terminal cleavage/methylation domain-containing protein